MVLFVLQVELCYLVEKFRVYDRLEVLKPFRIIYLQKGIRLLQQGNGIMDHQVLKLTFKRVKKL